MPSFSGESVGAIHGTLDLDRDPFTRSLEEAKGQVEAFEDERHRVLIELAFDGLDKAKAELEELHDATVRVRVDDGDAAAKLDDLMVKLIELHSQTVDVQLLVDGADKLALVKAEEDSLHDKTVKVNVDSSEGVSGLDALKNPMVAIAGAAAILGPQILGAVGQGTLAVGALATAAVGAAASFGVLGVGVEQAISHQESYAANLQLVNTAQSALNAAQKAGNAAAIQSAQQALATAKANLGTQDAAAQQVIDGYHQIRTAFMSAMGPGVNQVLSGIVSLMHTLGSSLQSLSGPFLALGTAFHNAFSSSAAQAGLQALVAGFGRLVSAAAPLVGPLLHGLALLGRLFLNIATAEMPLLVRAVQDLDGWLTKMVAHTGDTQTFRAELNRWWDALTEVGHAVVGLVAALKPLFESTAGFVPLMTVVNGLVGAFTHLLLSLGPVGRLLAGGLGIALMATRFAALRTVLGMLSGAFLKLAVASIGPLLSMFPSLVSAFWAMQAAVDGGTAALAGLELVSVPFIAAALAIVAVVALVIVFHRQLEEAVKWAWDAIKNVISTVMGAISSIVTAGWDLVKDHIKLVLAAILVIVTGGMALLPILVLKFHKQIEQIFAAAWHLIENIVTAAWHLLESAVEKGVSAVVSVVTTLPGKALAALGDIGHALFEAGKQLIEGFINGIEDMFSAVGDVMGSLVSNVTGDITSGFGILSPSKKAHGWGTMIGQGLANGLTDSMSTVHAATKALINGVAGAVGGSGIIKSSVDMSVQAQLVKGDTAVATALTHATDAINRLVNALHSSATASTAAAAATTAASRSPYSGPTRSGAPVAQQQSGGLTGSPVGQPVVVHVASSSLVPASAAQMRQISNVVVEAIRRVGPAPAPRRA